MAIFSDDVQAAFPYDYMKAEPRPRREHVVAQRDFPCDFCGATIKAGEGYLIDLENTCFMHCLGRTTLARCLDEHACLGRVVVEAVEAELDARVADGRLERHPTDPQRYRDSKYAGQPWE